MVGLGIAVLIGVTLFLGKWIGWRTHLPTALVLLALGVVVGYLPVPALQNVMLPPDVVLYIFLPALLYWEALNISTREMRRNTRVIVLSAIPLVIATAAIVAVVAHAVGMPWPVAIALGAIVAPTDATAVGPITRMLPRRTGTILKSESLINDGTALTIYAIAIDAITHHRGIDFGNGVLMFLLAYAGGIVVGIAVSYLVRFMRRMVRGQSYMENTVSVLTPFLAYLGAEVIHASGVIAVVTCGLVLSHYGPRMVSARTRVQSRGFWELASGLVNGALFLLIGLQAHRLIDELGSAPGTALMAPAMTLVFGVVIAVLVIASRLAWVNTTPYLIRALDRRPSQRARRATVRQRLVSGWAGFRGAVSLAAALALPKSMDTGLRAELIAITLVVIIVTLAVQGLTMPAVVRFAQLPADPSERDEELLAERTMRQAGEAALQPAADRLGTPDHVVDAVRRQYEELHARDDDGDPVPRWTRGSEGDLRRELIAQKRDAVIRLRDSGDIDDTVLTRMQDRLDIEELRLTPVAD